VVLENMTHAFPNKNAEEIKTHMKTFYKNFSDFIVESLKSLTISGKELEARVRILDAEVIEKYLKNGVSVLALTSHTFNWEWLLLASSQRLSAPLNPVYKRLNNNYFNNIMLTIRSRFGCRPIEMQETLKQITKRRDSANAFGLVADQTPLPDADIYWSSFLNQETAFFTGTERIAYLTKYPVVFIGMKKIKRGYYEIRYEDIAEPPYIKNEHIILDQYIVKTEAQIQERPAEWLWSHRRWKLEKPVKSSAGTTIDSSNDQKARNIL
jgi:KDO2-lipid IV(A) lauroyltransferase